MIRKKSHRVAFKPLTISTDGVKFSLKGMIPRQKSGFRKISSRINLKYRGYGHQTFENVVEVMLDGEKIGVMDVHPRALMTPDTVLFSVDNKIQYSQGWTKKIQIAWREMNLSFTHLNRLDIAVDQPYENQFDFIQDVITGKLKQVGNTRFSPLYEGNDDKGQSKLIYFTFGARSSDKFIRAYYKRQELAKSNKQYISEFWERNGFDLADGQEVARFEMVIKRKEFKKYKDVTNSFGELTTATLDLLENVNYLAAVFNTAKEKFFEFVSRRSFIRTGNISRCVRAKILDLSYVGTTLLEKIKSKVTTAIFTAKISAKFLYMLHLKTKEKMYLAQVDELLENFNLSRWFYANLEKYQKEFSYKYESPDFEYLTAYTSNPKFIQAKIWKKHEFTL